jgi:hypothetical protein
MLLRVSCLDSEDSRPMSDDPSEDEIIQKLDGFFAHPDPDARMKEFIRESDERRDREYFELHERLQVQRESDPRYWKGLYEGLLARIEQERNEKKRNLEVIGGLIIASGFFALALFVMDKLL